MTRLADLMKQAPPLLPVIRYRSLWTRRLDGCSSAGHQMPWASSEISPFQPRTRATDMAGNSDARVRVCAFALRVIACVVLSAAWLPAPASAQPRAHAALDGIAELSDRTGTNPANLANTVDLSNRFEAVDAQLFVNQVTWRYAQAFAGRRMRARVELPLTFGNITGRTEAGFGDVAAGWEWLAAVRGGVAVLAGVDLSFDTSSNDALAIGHHTGAPVVGLVVVPRGDMVVGVRYDQRFSLNAVAGWPDVNKGTLEGSVVRRFSADWWLRGVASLDVDVEESETWGTVRGEWGRMLSGSVSTWARAGAGLGASRPMDWTVEFGFRVVP